MLDLKQIESFYPENLRMFKRNLLREYLQYKILDVVFLSIYAKNLSFMGGTAIHIVHGNTRFSEDLDFDNKGLDKKDFTELSKMIQKKLSLEGYIAEISNSFEGAYQSYIKIVNILFDYKLSNHKEEKLLIKFDMEPQKFNYETDKVIINKFDVLTRINVVPANVLLSQKIYAIFMRKRPMGRDFYDAIFLLGKARPDFNYLSAKMEINDMFGLKEKLLERCGKLDFKQLSKDVRPFLFIPDESQKILFFTEYIKNLTV